MGLGQHPGNEGTGMKTGPGRSEDPSSQEQRRDMAATGEVSTSQEPISEAKNEVLTKSKKMETLQGLKQQSKVT